VGLYGVYRDVQLTGDLCGAEHPGEEAEYLALAPAELLDDHRRRFPSGGWPRRAVARADGSRLEQVPVGVSKLGVAPQYRMDPGRLHDERQAELFGFTEPQRPLQRSPPTSLVAAAVAEPRVC
jgi:hypothetical protein